MNAIKNELRNLLAEAEGELLKIANNDKETAGKIMSDVVEAIDNLKKPPDDDLKRYVFGMIMQRLRGQRSDEKTVKVPGNPTIDDPNPEPTRAPREIYLDDENPEDENEPIGALDVPTLEDCTIHMDNRIDQNALDAIINYELDKVVPGELSQKELYWKLFDLAVMRMQNPIDDPFNLILARMRFSIWDENAGERVPLYASVSELLRDNPHYIEKAVRQSLKMINKKIADWMLSAEKKFEVDKIKRSGKGDPVAGNDEDTDY